MSFTYLPASNALERNITLKQTIVLQLLNTSSQILISILQKNVII